MTPHSQALGSNHDCHDDIIHGGYHGQSSYGFCRVFDCLDGWSSILSEWMGTEEIDAATNSTSDKECNKNKSQETIDPILYHNPLAEKMVEDAVERSKYNTKSRQLMLTLISEGETKDHYDKHDDLLDQRVALAAMKRGRIKHQVQQRRRQQQSSISYSRRQHRVHQQQLEHHQQQIAAQQQTPHSFLKIYSKTKPERSQTPVPVPGRLRLDPKAVTSKKKANQIVPKKRNAGSTTFTISLLKRKDPNDSKRQSPPTSYCPPVSTPLVPIGEGKAMKLKKQKPSMKWSQKITPFQPDEY